MLLLARKLMQRALQRSQQQLSLSPEYHQRGQRQPQELLQVGEVAELTVVRKDYKPKQGVKVNGYGNVLVVVVGLEREIHAAWWT